MITRFATALLVSFSISVIFPGPLLKVTLGFLCPIYTLSPIQTVPPNRCFSPKGSCKRFGVTLLRSITTNGSSFYLILTVWERKQKKEELESETTKNTQSSMKVLLREKEVWNGVSKGSEKEGKRGRGGTWRWESRKLSPFRESFPSVPFVLRSRTFSKHLQSLNLKLIPNLKIKIDLECAPVELKKSVGTDEEDEEERRVDVMVGISGRKNQKKDEMSSRRSGEGRESRRTNSIFGLKRRWEGDHVVPLSPVLWNSFLLSSQLLSK